MRLRASRYGSGIRMLSIFYLFISELAIQPLGWVALRRTKASYLFDFVQAEQIIKQHKAEIKLVALDLDGTLIEGLDSIPSEKIGEEILRLTELGLEVAIITGGNPERVRKQLLEYLPAGFSRYEKLHIYANGGSTAYPLKSAREIDLENPYYEYRFTPSQKEKIKQTIQAFRNKFKVEILKTSGSEFKYTIFFAEEQELEVLEEYVGFLKEELGRLKEEELVVNAGGLLITIDIIPRDKGEAIKHILGERFEGLKPENLLIVGDSFSGLAGNDKAMIVPGALIFNVGTHREVPSQVYSLREQGPPATAKLLELLRLRVEKDREMR